MLVRFVKMPVGFRGVGIKHKVRPLATTVQLKRSIVDVGAEENYLAHVLIAITSLSKDPNYIPYMNGRKTGRWSNSYSRRQV